MSRQPLRVRIRGSPGPGVRLMVPAERGASLQSQSLGRVCSLRTPSIPFVHPRSPKPVWLLDGTAPIRTPRSYLRVGSPLGEPHHFGNFVGLGPGDGCIQEQGPKIGS